MTIPQNQAPDENFWRDLLAQRDDSRLLKQVAQYAHDYLADVDARPVYPAQTALEALQQFDVRIPDAPQLPEDVLAQLHQFGSPATLAQGGGRYFGYVNGGVLPVALAARWLADAWDQNAGAYLMSPIAAHLEYLVQAWLVDLLGLPQGTVAGFVSGTSTATMVGLLAGRNALLQKLGWDVSEQGLFGAPRLRIVMAETAHSTVYKALGIIGIGRAQIESIATDEQGRMLLSALPELDDHTLVVLQAGNVNTGAFEDFAPLIERAKEAGAWVHVDGAFGLWAAASDSTRHLTVGMGSADSWSVDGHKTLNTPYDSGVVLCRDEQALVQALANTASYIHYSDNPQQRDNMRYTPEMSRRARGVEMWALLRMLGRSGVDALIARLHHNAKLFGELLSEAGFTVLNDVVFNQVMVQDATPEATQATLQAIQEGGECWVGGSSWRGEPVIRISVCSWATTEDDVRRSVQAFINARAKKD
jgi:glutamate/tyrosine decarboxylase-like PLP-dependent enzyme